MEFFFLFLVFCIYSAFFFAWQFGEFDSKKDGYVVPLFLGWVFLGPCITFVFYDVDLPKDFIDLGLNVGNLVERLGSLALAFFIVSEIIIVYIKNEDLQKQIINRFRFNLDHSYTLYKMQRKRGAEFDKQIIEYIENGSFDFDKLEKIQDQVNTVFEADKDELDSRLQSIKDFDKKNKHNSSIHFFIIFGIIASTIIWGWGSIFVKMV